MSIQVGMRMEGMEYYLEKLFGPDGPFSNDKVSQIFQQLIRKIRSDPEDEDYLDKVKRLPNVIDNNFDNPRLSFSYKVFGNELKFVMVKDKEEIHRTLLSFNPWAKIKQLLSGQEIHYERTAMFLDSSYVVPTSTGLPIRLDLSGSAACNLRLSGLLESARLSSNSEFGVKGSIVPR